MNVWGLSDPESGRAEISACNLSGTAGVMRSSQSYYFGMGVFLLYRKLLVSVKQKKIYIPRSVARCARTSDGYTKADALGARAFLLRVERSVDSGQ